MRSRGLQHISLKLGKITHSKISLSSCTPRLSPYHPLPNQLANRWPLLVDCYFIASPVFELTSPSSFLGGFGINPMSSPTPEPVVRTSSYGTPSPSENSNDERLPPRQVAHGAAVAADAASPREHTLLVKCTLGVSYSSPRGRWKRCNNGVNHRSRPFGR
jgi:hypothetical protein